MVSPTQLEILTPYLLGDLPEAERAHVDIQLETDPELRAALRALTDDLGAYAHTLAGAAPELDTPLPTAIMQLKTAARSRPKPTATTPFPQTVTKSPSHWTQWGWPMAAAILLGLNLWHWTAPMRDDHAHGVFQATNESPKSDETGNASDSLALEIERLAALTAALESEREAILAEKALVQFEGEQWEERARQALAANQLWKEQYGRLVDRVSPIFDPDDNLTRYTVIELADPVTLASGGEISGFLRYADGLFNNLSEIAHLSGDESSGSNVFGDPLAADADSAEADTERLRIASQDRGNSSPELTGNPAAFTVWNDDDQSGFIDFYDMPPPAPGYEHRLYVRGIDTDLYQNVGTLPADFTTGSFSYSMTGDNNTPTGVMVTQEPIGGEIGQPSGSIVIQGPGD